MLDLLAMLKKGYCDGMKVRIGRLQNLISSSCTEHLDFMSTSDLPDTNDTNSFSQIHHEYIGYQSLTDVPRAQTYVEEKIMCSVRYFITFFHTFESQAKIIKYFRNTIIVRCQT